MNISTLEALLDELGLIDPGQRKGCTEREIVDLEEKYDLVLPSAYKDFMMAFGLGGSGVFDEREIDYKYNHVIDMTDHVRNQRNRIIAEELAAGLTDPSSPLPENIFFIANRYGEQYDYLLAEGNEDSKVYRFNFELDTFVLKYDGIWQWLEVNAREQRRLLDKR